MYAVYLYCVNACILYVYRMVVCVCVCVCASMCVCVCVCVVRVRDMFYSRIIFVTDACEGTSLELSLSTTTRNARHGLAGIHLCKL